MSGAMNKKITAIIISSISIFSVARADVATITSNTGVTGADTVTVASDEVIELLGSAHQVVYPTTSASWGVTVTYGSSVFRVAYSNTAPNNGDHVAGQVFPGPCVVKVGSQSNGKTILSYRIVDAAVYANNTSAKNPRKAIARTQTAKADGPVTASTEPAKETFVTQNK